MIGKVFGKRIVVGLGKPGYYMVKCECGHIGPLRQDYIKYGVYDRCKKCSWDERYDYSHLIGKTYGKLTILRHVGTKKGARLFECQCNCGVKVNTTIHKLQKGAKVMCKRSCPMPELIGKKFGELTILEFSHLEGRIDKRNKMYKVQCTCGHIQISRKTDLLDGKAQRCRACAMIKRTADNKRKRLTQNRKKHE